MSQILKIKMMLLNLFSFQPRGFDVVLLAAKYTLLVKE